jgi:hypothetical protein
MFSLYSVICNIKNMLQGCGCCMLYGSCSVYLKVVFLAFCAVMLVLYVLYDVLVILVGTVGRYGNYSFCVIILVFIFLFSWWCSCDVSTVALSSVFCIGCELEFSFKVMLGAVWFAIWWCSIV